MEKFVGVGCDKARLVYGAGGLTEANLKLTSNIDLIEGNKRNVDCGGLDIEGILCRVRRID